MCVGLVFPTCMAQCTLLAECRAVGELSSIVWEAAAAEMADNTCARHPNAEGRDRSRWQQLQHVSAGVLLMGAVYLVTPGDVVGLSEAIKHAVAMRSSERQWRTVRAAMAASACFSLHMFTERTLAIYFEKSPEH